MTKKIFFFFAHFFFYISGHITCSSCIKLQDQIDKQSSKFESHINELEKQKMDYFNSLEEISQENDRLKCNDGKYYYGNRIRFYGSGKYHWVKWVIGFT